MKLIEQSISLPPVYSVQESANLVRHELVKRGQSISSVSSAQDNEGAGVVVRDMRKHLKEVESARKELTEPLLNAQRLLKSLADDHCQPIKDELCRLEGMATAFLAGEQRRIAAEERMRQEAFQKAQQERFEAQDKAAKLAAGVKTEAGLERAIKAEEKAQEAAQAVQNIIALPEQRLQKSKGQSLKQVLCYEVLDLKAVYAARPELCKLEISPAAVKSTCNPNLPVPGLKLWFEDRSTFSQR